MAKRSLDVSALYGAARESWPGVRLAEADFARFLEGRVEPGAEPDPERVRELYLACACLQRDPAAISAFERAYFGELGAAVARFGHGTFVDDVKQELRQRLFLGVAGGAPKLNEYQGRGGLARWLRAVATRVALNLRRDRKEDRQTELNEDDLLGGPISSDDPELAHMKGLYQQEFKKAFADALAAVPAERQNFLRLYYLDGLGLAEIAGLFQSSAPTISRRLAQARAEVLEGTRALLKERLNVSAEDLNSIMRLIQSRLTLGPLPPKR